MLIRVFSYMKPYRKYAFLAGLCVAVECMFELIIPVLMANIVDVGVKNGDTGYIFTQGALMCLCAVIALFWGRGAPSLPTYAARGWARSCGGRSTKRSRPFRSPTRTAFRPRRW